MTFKRVLILGIIGTMIAIVGEYLVAFDASQSIIPYFRTTQGQAVSGFWAGLITAYSFGK